STVDEHRQVLPRQTGRRIGPRLVQRSLRLPLVLRNERLNSVAHLHLILWWVQLDEPEAPLLPRQPLRALHLAEAIEVGAGIAGCRRCSLDPVDHLVPQIGPAHAVGPEAAERLLSERRAAALPVRRYARLVKHVVCSVVVPSENLGSE